MDIDPAIRDSVKAGAIGGGGMVARLLHEDSQIKLAHLAVKFVVAAFITYVANHYLIEQIESSGTRAIACGLVGASSQELLAIGIKSMTRKANALAGNEEPKAKGKKKGGKRAKR